MKIAYYRDKKTGEIKNFHTVKEEMFAEGELQTEIEKFNNNENNKTTAFLKDIEKDSIEEYLINRYNHNIELNKETRDQLIESLREALDIAEDIAINS